MAQAVDVLKSYGLVPGEPRIQLVTPGDFPRQPVIASLRAFRLARDGMVDPVIYVVRTNAVYRLAERGSRSGIALLASTIRHELVHGDGGDEYAAVAAEIQFLHRYVLTERIPTDSLVWQIRALEHALTVPQMAAVDTVRAPLPTVPR